MTIVIIGAVIVGLGVGAYFIVANQRKKSNKSENSSTTVVSDAPCQVNTKK